jgi:proteasome lid subunit RPN8/RPN11
VIVRVPRRKMEYFRKKARKSPVEIFAVLVGLRLAPNLLEVHEINYPKIDRATKDEVVAEFGSFQEIYDTAAEDGYKVLGSMHSHIEWTPELSRYDYKNHVAQNDLITGICSIIGRKTFINFWVRNSPLPCTVEYMD